MALHLIESTPLPTLRAAQPSDLPLVFRLERAYIEEYEPAQTVGWHRYIDRHLEQWISNLPRMFVAQDQDQALGYCFWEFHGEEAVLASINVVPAHRRQGIGAILLRQFEADALAKGAKVLSLGVLMGNPARRLYEAAGYLFTHQESGYRYYAKHADTL